MHGDLRTTDRAQSIKPPDPMPSLPQHNHNNLLVTMSTADGWTPLLLSTVAGMSTCLGAAIVFFQPKTRAPDGSITRRVGPNLQAFSLALAGSVMLTVSVISIGPECLLDPTYETRLDIARENALAKAEAEAAAAAGDATEDGAGDNTNSTSPATSQVDIDLSDIHVGQKWMMPWSYYFFHRFVNFLFGCGLYMAIRYLFPEPEQVETELLAKIYIKAGVVEDDASIVSRGNDVEEGGSVSGGKSLRRRDSAANSNKNGSSLDDPGEMERLLEKVDGTTETQSANDTGENDDAATRNTAGTADSLDKTIDLYGGGLLNKIKTSGGQKYRDRKALVRRMVVSEGAAPHARPSRKLLPQDSWQSWASGEDLDDKDAKRAWRVAMLLFVSLAAHNFPEGLAVSAAALETDKLGITVTIGIAIHNIPEGIAVAIPCLAARPDSPWMSFALASISGMAEPLGAFFSLLFLRGFSKTSWMSLENVLAFVAGIMITCSIVELFPEAMRHSTTAEAKQWLHYGAGAGFVVMCITELVV